MSSRARRPRSKRRVVGVSAVAVGALLSTYAGALRTFSYARAVVPTAATCSAGAVLVSDDTQLQAAIASSGDDSIICVTADITLSATLLIDDTTITLEGREVGGRDPVLSGDYARRVIDADFTDNSSDDTLTVRDLGLVAGRASGQGGAVLLRGGNRSDALVMAGVEVAGNYSTDDGGGVSATNLSSVHVEASNFHDDTVGDAGAGDIAGGALKVANSALTTISNSRFVQNSSVEWGGAVLLNDSGVTRITGTLFQGNFSGTQQGGAIEVDIDDSTLPGALYIEDTVFRQNFSTSGHGGAVRVTDNDDTVTFDNVTFDGNSVQAANRSGGGLNISHQSGPVFLTDITATDNEAGSSGGFLRVSNMTSTLTIDGLDSQRNAALADGGSIKQTSGSLKLLDSTFADDSVGIDGGAVYADGLDAIEVTDSQFIGNYARDDAGGLMVRNTPTAYITSSVFRLNTVAIDDGGGILINNVDDTISLTNVTLDRNTTGAEGGGIKIVDSDGVVYASGITATGNSAGTDGGALYINDPVTTTVKDSNFTANIAGTSGGALYLQNNDGVDDITVFSNLTFSDDSAGEDGGSLYARVEGLLNISSVTATGTTSGDDGGFAYLRSDDTSVALADFTLSDVHVTSASTTGAGADGGGFSVGYANGLYLRDVTVTDSNAADDGGGMLVRRVAAVYIYESSFQGNAAADVSGGVDLTNIYSQLLVRDTTISGNSAVDYTGGLYTRFAADTQATILNSTITGNTVPSTGALGGGGMYLFGAPGTSPVIDLSFVTITGNAAKVGGGIQLGGTSQVNAENSIIAGNTASSGGADVYLTGSASLDDSFSLFTSASAVSGGVVSGPGTLFGAPKLNGLTDNGGPTQTMLPQWDSPAVKAGDPNWTAPPTNDQRGPGFPRNAGGRVNMGAIQGASAQPPAPTYPPSAPRDVAALAGDQLAVVSWTAPASSGSFPITNYQIDDSTGTISALVQIPSGEPLATTIEGLANGESYSFRVRALNGAGWGPWSAYADPVTPTPEPAILITGSRDGRYVKVKGTSTGIDGETLIPRIRYAGRKGYRDGAARPRVSAEGAFTWRRSTSKRTHVYFYVEGGVLRSNRVVIPAPR